MKAKLVDKTCLDYEYDIWTLFRYIFLPLCVASNFNEISWHSHVRPIVRLNLRPFSVFHWNNKIIKKKNCVQTLTGIHIRHQSICLNSKSLCSLCTWFGVVNRCNKCVFALNSWPQIKYRYTKFPRFEPPILYLFSPKYNFTMVLISLLFILKFFYDNLADKLCFMQNS